MADLAQLGESIKSALGGVVAGVTVSRGELSLDVAAADILKVMVHLRNAEDFKILVDLCGTDWPERPKRFDVVYHLLSLTKNVRVRVKAQVGRGESSCRRLVRGSWFALEEHVEPEHCQRYAVVSVDLRGRAPGAPGIGPGVAPGHDS